MRFCILFLIFISLSFSSFAQSSAYHTYLTAGTGGTSYRGDLSGRYTGWTGTFHAGILLNKKKRTNGYFHLMIGGVSGQNPDYIYAGNTSATPNTFFRTALFSAGYELRINLIKKDFFNMYISPGIAFLRFNPRDEYKTAYTNQFNTRDKNETFSNVSFLFPLKIGASYYLKSGYGIGVDFGFLNPTTDYIDNISKWGNRSKKDNLMQLSMILYIPLKLSEQHALE